MKYIASLLILAAVTVGLGAAGVATNKVKADPTYTNATSALTKTLNINNDVLLPGPLVGITTTDDKIYASGTGGAAVDSGKDLTFETTVGNASSVQDTGNWDKDGVDYALDLQNGDLEIYNRSNGWDNGSFGVASAYKGVGNAFSLNGSDYAPLVKSLGNNDYRLDLLDLSNGSITTTDLAFNSISSITGLGNGTGSSLASMPFLFTTDNQTILEGGVGKGIVAEYGLNTDIGSLTDVALDGSNLYVSTQYGPFGAVGVSENYTPIVPEPGDIDNDGCVDINDLAIIVNNWLVDNAGYSDGDLSGDGKVDMEDFCVLAENWMDGAE